MSLCTIVDFFVIINIIIILHSCMPNFVLHVSDTVKLGRNESPSDGTRINVVFI